MILAKLPQYISVCALAVPLVLLPAAYPSASVPTSSGTRIDSVPAKYELLGYSFELKAGAIPLVRLDYGYPGTYLNGDDGDRGPGDRVVEVPGLSYDSASHNIVYLNGNTPIVCAVARGSGRLKATGECRISARVVRNELTEGGRRDRLDIFFRSAPR